MNVTALTEQPNAPRGEVAEETMRPAPVGNDTPKQPEPKRDGVADFSAAVKHELREALAGGDMHQCIHTLAEAARVHRLTPERLLVIIKQELMTEPGFKTLTHDQRDDVRAEIVSMAIDEYFGSPGSA